MHLLRRQVGTPAGAAWMCIFVEFADDNKLVELLVHWQVRV